MTDLMSLTKSHTAWDGAVTFHMLPYRPMAVDVAIASLSDTGQVGEIEAMFVLCDPVTVNIEFGEDLPMDARTLYTYWHMRSGDIKKDWAMFTQVLSSAAAEVWWEARNAVQDTTANIDLPAESDTDPNG